MMTTFSTESKKPTIVIVGAGLAGLTTAYRLHQQGANVHVYEARNRVGGRILTAQVGAESVELGEQNLSDGGSAENIQRLIDELNLEIKTHRNHLSFSYFNGEEFLSESTLRKNLVDPANLKSKLEEVASSANNMRDVLDALFEEKSILYNALSVRLAAYEGAPPEKLSLLYMGTLYQMLLGGICAVHPGHAHEENYVEMISLKEGNQILPEKLAQLLGEKIHLNRPLRAVSKNVEGEYILTFQNEQHVKADILVLTLPCSIYKDITFEETVIPQKQLELIKSIQYGKNAKILIPFSQLPPEKMTFIDDQMGCFFADPNVLTLYFTGDAGQFSSKTITEAYLRERPVLERGFGKFCPPLVRPVYAQDEAMQKYQGPVGYSWPNDPYVKGSYSYIAPGQEVLLTSIDEVEGEKVKTLFKPIGNQLYFAGEHASILLDIPGTMEAACESGERTARMIKNGFSKSL